MIKIGILDLSGIKYSLDRKEKQSAQSKFARLLLKELYKDFSDKEMPEIKKGRLGKPYFDGAYPLFSITHEADLVAVIISDTSEVGIDIQSLPEHTASREKIAERITRVIRERDYYFTRAGVEETKIDEIRLFVPCGPEKIKESERGALISEDPLTLSSADADFLREWCELEALIKLSGGGFADTARVGLILCGAEMKSGYIKDKKGREYAICAAACRD